MSKDGPEETIQHPKAPENADQPDVLRVLAKGMARMLNRRVLANSELAQGIEEPCRLPRKSWSQQSGSAE